MAQTVIKHTHRTVNVESDITLRQVSKVFAGDMAVRNVDMDIARGEFFSILGPSGCGKTTTLRLIAGFDQPTSGDILIRGESMRQVPPYRRPVNTVFQSYALFSHLSVEANVAFSLNLQKRPGGEVQERVRQALHQVKMEALAKRYPAQLSGGQQQRVALARALVNRPAVILLDEPLGALDLKLRKEMQVELASLHRSLGLTFVMVTHDQEEALSLSDRIAVMDAGAVAQIGTPTQIYDQPQSQFVASFIGDTNLIQGKIEGSHPTMLWVQSDSNLKLMVSPTNHTGHLTSGPVAVSVRPEKIHLRLQAPEGLRNCFEGRVQQVMYLGTHVNCLVQLNSGDRLTVRQPHGSQIPGPETPVFVAWETHDCLALPT
jgi:spermidine/putrescine transport system ATP-binding protein